MTKVILRIEKDGSLMFDCLNHSGDHDVCTIASTLCGVLCQACTRFDENFEPTVYSDGHVRIDLSMTDETLREIFQVVEDVMQAAVNKHPEHIKIY